MAFSATQPSPHHFITALSIEEILQDRIINWIIMLHDEVILNNFVLITGQTEHWKWKPLLLWSFANWPIIFCIGKGSNSASHNVFSYVLFLGPSWVFLTCLCSDTWCDLPRTPTLHVAPCTGPCSGPGHLSPLTVWVEALVHGSLSHASWNDASHQAMLLHGSSTRFHKALTLHTRFLPNSPSAVWMPSSPGSGYHTTHWLPLRGMLFSPNSSCYLLSDRPPSEIQFLLPAPGQRPAPLTAPFSHADAFPTLHRLPSSL